MKYFEKYVSNTLAAGGSQTTFLSDGTAATGRIFYKIFAAGEYGYSLLFQNIMDSTFADGTNSAAGNLCDEWEILGVKIYRSELADPRAVKNGVTLTFGGKTSKTVAPGELFCSDEIPLSFKGGEYMCVEIAFRGERMPCHEESVLPVFVDAGNGFTASKKTPMPCMIGCNRKVKKRVVYLGDSITQGVGTPVDSYAHWAAKVSERLGTAYSFWNLGLGFGRAADAATDGSWLFKAKNCDVATVCFGVNDLFRGYSPRRITDNLDKILSVLHKNGVKVLLQSVPPFDYGESTTPLWYETNRLIESELAPKADAFFKPYLAVGKSEAEPHAARYGAHPGAEGCLRWAELLYPVLKELVERA